MAIPRIGLQSGFSFKQVYGSTDLLAERCLALGITHAALADIGGTWGHVPWEISVNATLAGNSLQAGFGERRPLPLSETLRPLVTVLATSLPEFYRFSSSELESEAQLASRPSGVIVLPGQATKNPDCFDYVDISHRSLKAARASLELAAATGKKIVLNPENDYPAPQHRPQFLAWRDSKRTTIQHVMSDEEMRLAYHFLDDQTWNSAVKNTWELAERICGLQLNRAPMMHVEGNLDEIIEDGRQYRLSRGHIKEWTKEYQDRLEYEVGLIKAKNYESYFLVVSDMVRWAKDHMLVGPARGSSAGSLVCYLTRITEVDPLVHGLIFERFIDLNRPDLPDIDIDFSDQHRHLVFEYMDEKYGKDNVARLGNISRLQSRSVINHVTKAMGIPIGAAYSVINVLIEHSSGDARYGKGLEDTLIDTQPGRTFRIKYPEADLMVDLEHHPSHTSVHAAGLLVCHEPIIEYCTVREGVAQIDKVQAEYLNLLKIDALGLRTLGVIEDSKVITQEELYSLPLDDQKAFDVINKGKFAGVFQFEGGSQRRITTQVHIDRFAKIDHLTALSRPGPLGGGGTQLYIEVDKGTKKISYIHPSMGAYLDETNGVAIYQEQVMRLVRELGNFSWEDTGKIRKGMSASKGPEFMLQYTEKFIEGAATHGIDRDTAFKIFYDMRLMAAWTMNKAHTCSYAIISYWCAWLKAYHPMEYAAALLRNAKDDVQTLEILRELKDEGIEYIPFDKDLSDINWEAKDGKIIGGFKNIVQIGEAKAARLRAARDEGEDYDTKIDKALSKGVKFTDLHPTRTLWADYYENPSKYNIMGRVKEFATLRNNEEAVVICKVDRVDRRDENEGVRIGRRQGKVWKGQSLFVDIHVTDDSVSRPIVLRFRPESWDTIGQKLADNLVPEHDWLLVRGRWLADFNMMIGKKVKCLTNENIFTIGNQNAAA